MGLTDDLGRGPVALDTCIFIYWIEEHPRYLPLISPLFESADRGERELIASALTLLEVLVVPYREGNPDLAERYEQLLTRSRGLRLRDIGRVQLRAAAQLRAIFGIRTPDALQLACALEAGCGVFVTNDRRLRTLPGLRVLELSSYVNAGGNP